MQFCILTLTKFLDWQGIASPERCWLLFESWEENPPPTLTTTTTTPSLHLLSSVVPLHQCDIVCDLRFLLFSTPVHFPALCERLHLQRLSRKDGLLSVYIMLSEAQSLPRSLLSAQKRPVVLRYGPVSCCAVARWWSALMFTCCIPVKVRRVVMAAVQFWGISLDPREARGCWMFIMHTYQLVSVISPTTQLQTKMDVGFSGGSKWFSRRVTVNQAWQEVCVATEMICPYESSWQECVPLLGFIT